MPAAQPASQAAIDGAVHAYVAGGMRRVDGWLTALDAGMTATVAACQGAAGLPGSVGEIGIHHGRMFLLLALGLRPGERAFAVDVFDEQGLNLDRSGRGDEAIFRANLDRYGIDPGRVDVFRRSSLTVTWPELLAVSGQPVRLASVDGGHTADVVANDLGLIAEGLADHGVIVLDDYFTAEFPGVSEGAARFLVAQAGRVVPFALGDSRMLFCRPDWAERYRAALADSPAQRLHIRDAALWDGTAGIYRTPRRLMHRVRRTRLAQALRDHPLGLRLKPLVRRVLPD